MLREPGIRFGHYEIITAIGKGGMSEVYLARDTRLDRIVALKVLKGPFSARAEHEARVISTLDHPNICTLFDIGVEGEMHYLVFEYLKGQTLASRLERGELPVNEVLTISQRLASALRAAHHSGIIHGDVKPANVFLSAHGPKLIDFGVARPSTQTDQPGSLQATPYYMAPELSHGAPPNAQSDIYSFGMVMADMMGDRLAGWPALHRIVRRATETDAQRRWSSMEAIEDALDGAAEGPRIAATPPQGRRGRTVAAVLVGTALVVAAVAAFATRTRASGPRREIPLRVNIALPTRLSLANDSHVLLSPNGLRVVVGSAGVLWMRSLDTGELRPLPSTGGGYLPFWAPDGQHLGFFAEGKLKTIALPEGPVETLCDAPNPSGGAWNGQGQIVFGAVSGPLQRIPASGGPAVAVTRLNEARGEDLHTGPAFLPDGQHFLYWARSRNRPNSVVALGSLQGPGEGGDLVVAPRAASSALYAGGYLLYLDRGNLTAQPFDAEQRKTTGEPFVLVRRIRTVPGTGIGTFSVAGTTALAYAADDLKTSQPRWFNREGLAGDAAGLPSEYVQVRLSPDQQRVASIRLDASDLTRSLWVHDLRRGVDHRIETSKGGEIGDPVWSPDGSTIAFGWSPDGSPVTLYQVAPERGVPTPLLPSGAERWTLDWSADGANLIYAETHPLTLYDLWRLPMKPRAAPVRIVSSPGHDNEARLSPDGRWLAYQSDHTGIVRVYLRALDPGNDTEITISEGHGAEPRWRADGRELYYISGDRALMAVPIELGRKEARPGKPVKLFGGRDTGTWVWKFEVAGPNRFLVLTPNENSTATPIHLIWNWRALVP